MNFYNKHYIRIDKQSNIVHGFSDAFIVENGGNEQILLDDICINEKGGRQFEILIDGETKTNFTKWGNPQGIYLYRWIDGQAIAKTPQEIESEMPHSSPSIPSLEERVLAFEKALIEMAGEIYG